MGFEFWRPTTTILTNLAVKKSLSIGAISITAMVVGGAVGIETNFSRATPITSFSAPFIFGQFRVPADNPLTDEAVELGRRLFYDVRLSGNNEVSCATCHRQQLAFTDGRQTAVGASGEALAFNSMSLANLMWGPRHFFWNGRVTSLEAQALVPIQDPDEMGQDLVELVDELKADAEYTALFKTAYGSITEDHITKA